MDSFLGQFEFYRQWRGGTWYCCVGRCEFAGLVLWTRTEPSKEVLYEKVVYKKENKK